MLPGRSRPQHDATTNGYLQSGVFSTIPQVVSELLAVLTGMDACIPALIIIDSVA